MVNSKTTDKLKIVCDTAIELLKSKPNLSEKVKSINIIWTNIDDTPVPDIKIEFYE